MRSLRRTLVIHLLLGVSVVTLLAVAGVFLVARWHFRSQFDAMLVDRARTLGALVVVDEDQLEFELDQSVEERTLGVRLRIADASGQVIAESPGWPAGGEGVSDAGFSNVGPDARRVDMVLIAGRDPDAPALGPGESSPSIVVSVIGRLDAVRRAEAMVLGALAFGGLAILIGSGVVVWTSVGHGLRPVRELGAAVDRVDPADLRLPPGESPEEIRPIVGAIERLLERTGEAMERERRFTDAAAHEMRTPLAELRTIVDVADRWPEPERLQRAITDARPVIDHLNELLTSLLEAARGTSSYGDHTEVPLIPLARQLADDARRRLGATVQIDIAGDEQAAWHGPQAAVTAIIRNLIDNALEYTPAGGCTRVTATGDNGSVVLEVENGPVDLDGLIPERLFEPFWRGDGARSDRTHHGLGLAIVDALAEALDLRREASITPDGRLRISIGSLVDEQPAL